ncbi:MAG: response regulator transcription factor [Clostridia bacterium]|nr:response regulator transcription factor [Clostridia bacterium]MBR3753564.1 response regulator transcription factor [Clostridia bacterium]
MAMKRIIVADDEARIRRLVCDFLSCEGYEAIEAADGDVALEIFNTQGNIDALILDVMMPNMDGWEVCRKIREKSNVPILMLTARSEEFDELMGFEVGADDYVTKPFSPGVLMKRVAALLRRAGGEAEDTNSLPGLDGLKVDEIAHVVTLDGTALELTLKEYNILLKLLSSVGRVFSREQLLDDIWGYDYAGDIRTVDSHVARLRTKLGIWGNEHLKTVYGIGYKIEAE